MQFSLAAGSERAVREGGRRCQIQLWQDGFLTVLIFSSWSTVTHFGKTLNTHTLPGMNVRAQRSHLCPP